MKYRRFHSLKRILNIGLIFVIIITMIALIFTSCAVRKADDGKTSVVAANFPAFDFARAVCGASANVTMLLPAGGESHTYEPTAQDILKIQNCDLFIYTGGESDVWADKILKSFDKDINTLKMMDCVNLIPIGGENADHKEFDEHVWTSPLNAAAIVERISGRLSLIDPQNKNIYEENAASYINELNNLDSCFRDFFKTVQNKILIFGDRFPIIYFTNEYGIDYMSAFPGCADHSEASASVISEIIEKINSENISTVYYIEFSNKNIANTIADSTNTETALFYTCHNVSVEQLKSGETYISLMTKNLETLNRTMH